MYVGALRVVIQIPAARSLKDRRSVVRGLKDRLRARLRVAVAEVGDVERWQVATVGVSVVSRERRQCVEVLDRVRSIAASLPDALLADVRTEILSFGPGGERLASGLEDAEVEDGR